MEDALNHECICSIDGLSDQCICEAEKGCSCQGCGCEDDVPVALTVYLTNAYVKPRRGAVVRDVGVKMMYL